MKKTWIFLLLGALCHGCKDKNPSFRLPPDAVAEISVTSLSVDTLWLDTVPTSYMIESGVCDDYLYVVDKKLCVLYRYEPTGRLRGIIPMTRISFSKTISLFPTMDARTRTSWTKASFQIRCITFTGRTCTSVPMGIRFIVQYMICGGIIIWKTRGFISTRLLTYGK